MDGEGREGGVRRASVASHDSIVQTGAEDTEAAPPLPPFDDLSDDGDDGDDPFAFNKFYGEYHGHDIDSLKRVAKFLRDVWSGEDSKSSKTFIWLIGDSSLDNKYWFEDSSPACNGYEELISGDNPKSKEDIAYWMNRLAVDEKLPYVCINGAVEESTLGAREEGLNPHDQLVHDSMQDGDILICSVGGNDVALRPSAATRDALTKVVFAPLEEIKGGTAEGMDHLIELFKDQVKTYLERVAGDKKPSKILVCMIYFPGLNGTGWADMPLNLLGYIKDKGNPELLQTMIRTAFELATKQITMEGVADADVVPVPLFHILDPENQADYVARVEPSSQGGKKMATKFLDAIAASPEVRMTLRGTAEADVQAQEAFWKPSA